MELKKVKIVEKGWKGFSGALGGEMFEDGISVNALTKPVVDMIAACIRVETLDGEEAGHGAHYNRMRKEGAPVVAESKPAEVAEQRAPAFALNYTREQLEGIASEKGIKGLRAIAEPLGIKNNSVGGMVNELLAHCPPAE